MSIWILSPNSHSPTLASLKPLAAALARWALAAMLAACVLGGGYALQQVIETPGQVIRHDLARAAARLAQLPSVMPRDRVEQTISGYFSGYRASIDATGFPASVSVTLRDLDPNTCRDAYRRASRIEGTVVVAIDEPGARMCGDRTALTWRMMP
jgi:hypothetical protein